MYYFGSLFVLLVLLCLFKDTCTGPFLGWPAILAGLSRIVQILRNHSAYFFEVRFDTGAIPVLQGTVNGRHARQL